MYGTFPPAWDALLRPLLKGRRVLDVGSGDGERAARLMGLGATTVLGLDAKLKDAWTPAPLTTSGVAYVQGYFDQVYDQAAAWRPHVVHLAWPINHDTPGLVLLLSLCDVVIYIGCNTEGTACGTPDLFRSLRHRPIRHHVPDPRNTLIVYGAWRTVPRARVTHEELAGLHNDTTAWRRYRDTPGARFVPTRRPVCGREPEDLVSVFAQATYTRPG